MTEITITEALVAELADRADVDGSNVIQLLRNAKANLSPNGMVDFELPMPIDEVDSILILASQNGRLDIYGNPGECIECINADMLGKPLPHDHSN